MSKLDPHRPATYWIREAISSGGVTSSHPVSGRFAVSFAVDGRGARRAEIPELVAEGLISGSDARRVLEGIAATLGQYEAERAPSLIANRS